MDNFLRKILFFFLVLVQIIPASMLDLPTKFYQILNNSSKVIVPQLDRLNYPDLDLISFCQHSTFW